MAFTQDLVVTSKNTNLNARKQMTSHGDQETERCFLTKVILPVRVSSFLHLNQEVFKNLEAANHEAQVWIIH